MTYELNNQAKTSKQPYLAEIHYRSSRLKSGITKGVLSLSYRLPRAAQVQSPKTFLRSVCARSGDCFCRQVDCSGRESHLPRHTNKWPCSTRRRHDYSPRNHGQQGRRCWKKKQTNCARARSAHGWMSAVFNADVPCRRTQSDLGALVKESPPCGWCQRST